MQTEVDKLLDHSVEYATELLIETGESYPFGAYIDTVGNVHPLEMEIDTANVPKIGKVIEVLRKYCETELAENRMTAYCISYEVSVQLSETEKTDAICFDIMTNSGQKTPYFYLPFTAIPKEQWELDNPDFARAQTGQIFAVQRS